MRNRGDLAKFYKALFGDLFAFDPWDVDEWLDWALETLDPREKCVIEKRFFERKTLKQTGKLIVNLAYDRNPCSGVSKDRARQIEAKALRKLRHPTRTRKLKCVFNHGRFIRIGREVM